MHGFMEEPRRKKNQHHPENPYRDARDAKMVAKRPWIARGEHPDCAGMGGVGTRERRSCRPNDDAP